MQSDVQIVTKIQKGNAEDFVVLYEKYAKKIFDFIFYKIGNKEETEDLTSEVFLKAFNNIAHFDIQKQTSFSSRLYTIAKNLVIDHFRTRHEQYEYERLEQQSIQEDLLQNIQDKEILNNVMTFLNTLGESKKQLFILKIWNELSYEEISQILGKTPNACKVEFHRVLQNVIKKFGISIILLLLKHAL